MPIRGQKTLDELPKNALTQKGAFRENEEATSTEGTTEGTAENDPTVRVEILGDGHFLNGHPLKTGHVIEMTASQVDLHRERGFQLGPVADDYDGEVYDYSEPWQPQAAE